MPPLKDHARVDQRALFDATLETIPGAKRPPFGTYVRALMPRLARKAGIERRVHARGLRHTHTRDGYNSHPCVGQWGSRRPRASRGSAVVVMEPPENRDARDAALEFGRTRNRLLLVESLVRTRLVVEADELGDEASEVVLAEEEDVVE
jgi:hypothetical protein